MDSFHHQKHDKPTTTTTTTTTICGSHTTTADSKKHHPKPSKSELLSSAKLVATVAKSSFGGHDPDNKNKVDKAKVAGAAADLINAASSYGKFEEKGYGKYVDKAEDYLHKYHTTHSTTTTTTGSGHSGMGKTQTTTASTTHSSAHSDGKEQKSGSGYGEYIKIAEGFLKKH